MTLQQFHDLHETIRRAVTEAGLKLAEFRIEYPPVGDAPEVRVLVAPLSKPRAQETLSAVAEFHETFGVPIRARPGIPMGPRMPEYVSTLLTAARDTLRQIAATGDRRALRLALETEELHELFLALQAGDVEAALDAKIDQRYVSDGTVLELGMADVFPEGFRRVHAANMRKLAPDGKPVVLPSGKIAKPKGWEPPTLADLIAGAR